MRPQITRLILQVVQYFAESLLHRRLLETWFKSIQEQESPGITGGQVLGQRLQQLLSAVGGLAWATIVGVAGYLLGSNLALITTVIRDIGIGGLVVVLVLVVIAVLARRRAARP